MLFSLLRHAEHSQQVARSRGVRRMYPVSQTSAYKQAWRVCFSACLRMAHHLEKFGFPLINISTLNELTFV